VQEKIEKGRKEKKKSHNREEAVLEWCNKKK